jgi:hypothetical protein
MTVRNQNIDDISALKIQNFSTLKKQGGNARNSIEMPTKLDPIEEKVPKKQLVEKM